MTPGQVAAFLMCLGAVGVVEFATLAICARQPYPLTSVRMRQRMSRPAVRHAPSIALVFAAILVAGFVLHL